MAKSRTHVQVLREVTEKLNDGDVLCLQQVVYDYGNGDNSDPCFRFIRRDGKTNNMKAQMGQAAIPDLSIMIRLNKSMQKVSLKFSN